MKPRLLFLAAICLMLYAWYAMNSDQYIRVLNRALKHDGKDEARASTKEDSLGHPVTIAGPELR